MADESSVRVALVFPCYNEEHRLERDELLRYVDEHPEDRLLLVNDGSTDGTGALLRSIEAERPNQIQVLELERNAGKAEAVRRGMLRVAEWTPTYFGYWDADLDISLDEVEGLLHAFDDYGVPGGADAVLASRVRLLGRRIERSAARHLLGRVFATCASLTLQLPVYDTQCGAKLFRCEPRMVALFREPFSTGWTFDVELLARYLRDEDGSRLVEHPLRKMRLSKDSKVRPHDFFIGLADLSKIALQRRR